MTITQIKSEEQRQASIVNQFLLAWREYANGDPNRASNFLRSKEFEPLIGTVDCLNQNQPLNEYYTYSNTSFLSKINVDLIDWFWQFDWLVEATSTKSGPAGGSLKLLCSKYPKFYNLYSNAIDNWHSYSKEYKLYVPGGWLTNSILFWYFRETKQNVLFYSTERNEVEWRDLFLSNIDLSSHNSTQPASASSSINIQGTRRPVKESNCLELNLNTIKILKKCPAATHLTEESWAAILLSL